MRHVQHIHKNKMLLEQRSHITRLVREFFWSQDFLEVETPNLLALPGQEPYLSPVKMAINDEQGTNYTGYLHTSPEYALKKMLAAGFENIFSLGKCYRNYESFGGHHNPEFTMIEWYRAGKDMWQLMDDVEGLFEFVIERMPKNDTYEIAHLKSFRRLHMREAWQLYAGVNLDEYLEIDSMRALCIKKGYKPTDIEPFEDLFYRIFLNEIEPKLSVPTIIHHYPVQMAALSKTSTTDPRYAERFEAYVGGVELANAFTELTDANEQRQRLLGEHEQRASLGKDVFAIDEEFIDAVGAMPASAGISLGIDRFVQVLLGVENIDDVLVLPASVLFDT